ncbi:unnamed protein product [Rhizophagus irregularis]|uniref:Uncharacterized protein n=4 Tax=Rhizophagus irregularis TaxID=588596 RepID=U9T9W4_RHIID|nr:hypothetical protein GLOIN_2v1869647 [Rhizophagus irregularis DAOM 181602=DAOM 197198]ANQ32928.1 MATA-HMG [Rhizophagus irregularis]ANQ32930.1 MATA-HMG [Rhizophagus irregularis]ANQ32931.1 MATA-HMG [Rhizophagus irregularis]ANQ32932.1 MATA-HMG [Rhizophagus irregularis]POG79726.1 hypothetical protein GLOIN_2v1869647 [Rhizophagus irregularis DAOM 181602=DAOM 197198]|eukprot:XP_025186592.1 hypothetical protein GLOIN_2v1869647 [Rhizophagus irregularis DAOM 181602=DAOM 197198]
MMDLQKNIANDTTILMELPAPKIFIPYPQTLDPKEFLPKQNSRKPCNGFMIYRKVYQKQLNANSYRFKMTIISRWASALWLEENEKLKDAYRQFASKIAKIHSENHKAELENLDNRINNIKLSVTPYIYIPPRSQQFISPPLTPLISDSISSISPQYYYLNQSFPYSDLYLDNQQFCTPNDLQSDNHFNHFHNIQQNAENLPYNEIPSVASYMFQTLPSSIEQALEDCNNYFFDDSL